MFYGYETQKIFAHKQKHNTYRGLFYTLRVLYAPKLEGTKPPWLPLVSPTWRFKATTPHNACRKSPKTCLMSIVRFLIVCIHLNPDPVVIQNSNWIQVRTFFSRNVMTRHIRLLLAWKLKFIVSNSEDPNTRHSNAGNIQMVKVTWLVRPVEYQTGIQLTFQKHTKWAGFQQFCYKAIYNK